MNKMEFESPIQLSIRRNRVKCLDLNYPKMASLLISESILTEAQHMKIKNASTDSVGRMDDLMSLLYELNSDQAFKVFLNGVIISGADFELAESLRVGESGYSEGDSVNVQLPHDKHKIDCLRIPEVLSKVFSYLSKNELLNARRVCNSWNGVVSKYYASLFTLQLKTQNDLNDLIASDSIFCKDVTSFRLSINTYSEAERGIWRKFFERHGKNIKSLTLSKLNREIVHLAFSDEIQPFLKSVTQFHLNVSLQVPFVQKTELFFLTGLKHLTITATGEESEYGQIEFLSKFVKLNHKLESLILCKHFCIGEMPMDILPNLFRANTIKSIEITGQPAALLGHGDFKSLTSKNSLSRLENFKFHQFYVISPIYFHKFLVSHRNSLKKISIRQDISDHFPTLDCLTHLESSITINRNGLSFCTQFPNLEVLRLWVSRESDVGRLPEFEHKALRFFYLNWSAEQSPIHLIRIIPSYFPNLTKFELSHNSREVLPLQVVGKLQHKIREPGKSVWIST